MINPKIDNIVIGENIGVCEQKIQIESKLDVETEYFSKLISCSCMPQIVTENVENGKVKYAGKSVFFFVYIDGAGEIKKCQSFADFDGEILCENILEDSTVFVETKTSKVDVDRTGVKIVLNAEVELKVYHVEKTKVDYVSGGDDLINDEKEFECRKSFGVKKSTYPFSDEFDVNYIIKEVLNQNVECAIKDVQCGVGCVIVDGELYYCGLFLDSQEKKNIIRENKTFSFRAELEYDDALPSMSATAIANIKSLKTEIAIDEESGKSTITISSNIALLFEAYVVENISFIEDSFSTKENIEIEYGDITTNSLMCNKSFVDNFSANVGIDTVENSTFVSVVSYKANLISCGVVDSEIRCDGELVASCLLKDESEKYYVKKLSCPLTFSTKIDEKDCNIFGDVTISNIDVAIASLEEVRVSACLTYSFVYIKDNKLKFIKNIKSVGEKKENHANISVYIPLKNESLWDLSKRLNTCPNDIVAVNKDLQFPLSGEERIIVYRQ